jgi:BirA family biotin operon repressor/biotin-[acetyl-CoA-carboxylase] ligase
VGYNRAIMNYFSFQEIELSSTSSTNLWALEHAHKLDPSCLTAIWTKKQTAGRGRLGRKWESGKGEGLTVSYAFFTNVPLAFLSPLSLVCSLSVRKALCYWPFTDLAIKWPNDLYARGKKLAGILIETKEINSRLFVVIGIGVNILQTDLAEVGQPATSLFLETQHRPQLENVQQKIAKELHQDLSLFLQQGFSPFQRAYNNYLLRRTYTYRNRKGEVIEGQVEEVDQQGRLLFLPSGAPGHFLVSEELLG